MPTNPFGMKKEAFRGGFYVQGTIPYSEIRAVEFENIARPSNQQRTTYDGFELNFYLQKIRGSIDKYYGFE